ncbi:MAG TPA: transporter substrate-binding domain-containing protein [Vicinamibacterales bacterium]|jgi:polar amino acid transport system substrate-binding protein|nr:transporter substrate-binding domain-containing protein [Vicinamibacterales bacterium]
MITRRHPRGVSLLLVSASSLLLCGSVSLIGRAQAPAPLTLVSTIWPPFTDESGRPRFALDLVETALDRTGRKARITLVTPTQFTSALVSGAFDGSAAVWKDAERERALLFSRPYMENRLVLVGRFGADVSARTIRDLEGKRVALVEGYAYGEETENSGAVLVRSSSEEDSLALLLKGAVDYTLMDDLVVAYIVRNHPKESSTRLQIGSTLVKRELYLAIRRSRSDAQAIITDFNAQLTSMIADRTYHRLLQVDWIEADINGDSVLEYVPREDRAGTTEPKRVYALFSPPQTSIRLGEPKPGSDAPVKPGFYVGGNIYSDWASVPDSYKVNTSRPPDPKRSTASIFNFRW